MLLKIDLSKAFDSISWEYMQSILKAFGFAPSWVRWVSSLISSSFFSILINGIPSSTFRPSRGIRQGDPLSPFLFVIMAEGLGRSINTAILSRKIKASGALINRVKSQLFFFNTPPTTQRAIARILGFSIATLPSKYLGAPLIASALKHASWTNLLEKLEARLFLWTHRALNMASRIILTKAVLQSMPLYLFTIMEVPKWVLKAIKQLQRNFLWGSLGPNRKWALVKWEKATLPKNAGGIGLRDPEHNNIIMGAKTWWKWLANPGTPWAILWKSKYARNLPLEERLRMSEVSKGYVTWNSAIKHKEIIQRHSFWEVRDGGTAKFWGDSWQQLPNLNSIIQGLPIR
eukprot:PITA_31323